MRVAPIMLLGLCLLWGAGCVQRTISITSQPAGALVFLNDDEVGRTPVAVPFTFYGTYDVRLEREGFRPLWVKQKAEPPVWEYPGPDLIAEAIPNNHVELKWHFDMEPLPAVEERSADELAGRARDLRQQLADTPVPPELSAESSPEPTPELQKSESEPAAAQPAAE